MEHVYYNQEKTGPRSRMIYQTDETRDRILETATRLFTAQGLFDTHMKDVAIAVGISRTSLYRYFQDKFDLATAILQRMMVETEVSLGTTSTSTTGAPVTGLSLVEVWLRESFVNPAHVTQFTYIAEYDAYYAGTRVPGDFKKRLFDVIQCEQDDYLLECIHGGIKDGSIRSDIDPHLCMVTIYNAFRSLQQRLLLRGNALLEVHHDELAKMLNELIRYLIAGIANKA